jgi:hypothetical protein
MILLQIVPDVANPDHKALRCETLGSNAFSPTLHILGLFARFSAVRINSPHAGLRHKSNKGKLGG